MQETKRQIIFGSIRKTTAVSVAVTVTIATALSSGSAMLAPAAGAQAESQSDSQISSQADNRPYDEQAIKHYNSAVEMQQQGKIDEAISEYQAAIEQDNRIEEAWSNLGGIYAAQKDYTKASLAFEKALSLKPDRPASLNGYGTVLFERGKVKEAKDEWRQAIKMDPSFAAAHFNLANALEESGDTQGAYTEYEAAYKSDPEMPDVKERLAQAKEKIGSGDAAASATAAPSSAAGSTTNDSLAHEKTIAAASGAQEKREAPPAETTSASTGQESTLSEAKSQAPSVEPSVSSKPPEDTRVADNSQTEKPAAVSQTEAGSDEDKAAEKQMRDTIDEVLGKDRKEETESRAENQSASTASAAKNARVAKEADSGSPKKDPQKDPNKETARKGTLKQAADRPTVATRLASFKKRMITAMNRGPFRTADQEKGKDQYKEDQDKAQDKTEGEGKTESKTEETGQIQAEPESKTAERADHTAKPNHDKKPGKDQPKADSAHESGNRLSLFFKRRAAHNDKQDTTTDAKSSEDNEARISKDKSGTDSTGASDASKKPAATTTKASSTREKKELPLRGLKTSPQTVSASDQKRRLNEIAHAADALRGPKQVPAALALTPPDQLRGTPQGATAGAVTKKIAVAGGATNQRRSATAIKTKAEHPPAPFKVAQVVPLDNLNQAIDHDPTWRGADGAASTLVAPNRSLWIFGDTLVRKVDPAGRNGKSMINNSAAWLSRDTLEFKFFWRTIDDDPHAIVVPDDKAQWFWPTDAVVVDGRLYLVAKLIAHKKATPPDFAFDWIGDQLLCIEKPGLPPDQWTPRPIVLPDLPGKILMGAASLASGSYLYQYCSLPGRAQGMHPHPIGLARINKRHLTENSPQSWEYMAYGVSDTPVWSKSPDDMSVLFEDGAAEITISKLTGEPYFVATYMPPMTSDICLRFSKTPEGPWSEPLKVYKCAESSIKVLGKNVMVYSAKDHSELSKGKDQMVITYCVNPGDLDQQNKRPDLYFPRALTVTLSKAP